MPGRHLGLRRWHGGVNVARHPISQSRFRLILFAPVAAAMLTLPLLAGSMSAGKPEEVGLSTERLKRIGDVVRRHIEARDVAGVVTLVARRGKIAYFDVQGMADIEAGKPMARDSIFRLASMSKPITGIAVMMLVEEGKVRLSDPVSRFIPEFKTLNKVAVAKPDAGPPAAGGRGGRGGGGEGAAPVAFDVVSATREVTIRDMLTHGSGLVSGGLGSTAAPRRTDTDTLATYIPKLAAVPLDFQPGTLWRYSGQAGFDVLSRVVEVVSGQTFDQFLKQRLFDPLGMKDTGFVLTPDRAPRLAVQYQRSENGLQRNTQNQSTNTPYFSGAGGLMSTAEDYVQFGQMMLNGGELNGRRFVSPKTMELMTSNHTGDMVNGQFGRPARGMGFGLSMQVVQDPVAADLAVSKGAYGWAGGTGVSFWVEPKEQIVSIFLIQGSGAGLRPDFETAVRQAIID
jgi:CubicO group peptidase (beta-lactamase class C family)